VEASLAGLTNRPSDSGTSSQKDHSKLLRFRALAVLSVVIGLLLSAVAMFGVNSANAAPTVQRSAIAQLALAQSGNSCGEYTNGNCDPSLWWCAAFAEWVWRQAGISPVPTTLNAQGVGLWGVQNGLFKARPSGQIGDPQPGDLAIFGQPASTGNGHVAVVASVNGNGTITTVNGDYGPGPLPSNNRVVVATINPITATSGGDGVPISGYVTPPGATDSRTSRIGVLQGGAVSVKEGALGAGWTPEYGGGVAKFVVDGDWIGVLTTGGQLLVKQGNLSAGWVPEMGNVKDFALAAGAGRVGVLRTDGTVAVKDGGLYGNWDEETGGVAELRLSGDWIGVVGTNGQASVKEGPLNAGWLPEIGGVADLQLDQAAGRVGVLRTDGTVAVKDGGLYGNWDEETNQVQQLQLTSY